MDLRAGAVSCLFIARYSDTLFASENALEAGLSRIAVPGLWGVLGANAFFRDNVY